MVKSLLLLQRTGVRVPAPTGMLTTVTSVLEDSTLSLVSKSIYIYVHTPLPPTKTQNNKSHSILGLLLSGGVHLCSVPQYSKAGLTTEVLIFPPSYL